MSSSEPNWQIVLSYKTSKEVEFWVHEFLLGPGKNQPFSEGLKLIPRYFHLPKKISLRSLNRCCGPEPEMEYFQPQEAWDSQVGNMRQALKNGWLPPPLIVSFDGNLIINDGNHRHEALICEGYSTYWSIVWCSSEEDYGLFLESIK